MFIILIQSTFIITRIPSHFLLNSFKISELEVVKLKPHELLIVVSLPSYFYQSKVWIRLAYLERI